MSRVMGKSREELIAMAKEYGDVKKGKLPNNKCCKAGYFAWEIWLVCLLKGKGPILPWT